MEEEAAAMKSTQRKHSKSHPHFNNKHCWKIKLRENCYQRVREDRRRLLWKMRLLPTSEFPNGIPNDLIQSALQDIVSAEFRKLNESSQNEDTRSSTSVPEVNDMLWEYDDLESAYQGDCEDIMIEMQRIFYEDLSQNQLQELFAEESCVQSWEDEEDEYLARAVYEHMQLNGKKLQKDVVWCPICKHGELQENNRLIYCTRCKIQLSKGYEVTLELLRVRLAEVHAQHVDGGCKLKPKFCIETRFDITALYINCSGCSTFEIVI